MNYFIRPALIALTVIVILAVIQVMVPRPSIQGIGDSGKHWGENIQLENENTK